MSSNKGTYVKIYRKIVDWEWYKNPATCRLYEHLIYKANYEEKKFKNIVIKSGQRMTSLDSLAHETGLSRQQIRTALKNLELTHDITQQVTHHYRIITLCNYETYQIEKDKSNTPINTPSNKQSTHQLTPIKEVKNNKNKILQKHEAFAERFYQVLKENELVLKNINPKSISWIKPIQLLETTDGIEWETITNAAKYYFSNLEDTYIPTIKSTTSFRKKFEQLIDHYQRSQKARA